MPDDGWLPRTPGRRSLHLRESRAGSSPPRVRIESELLVARWCRGVYRSTDTHCIVRASVSETRDRDYTRSYIQPIITILRRKLLHVVLVRDVDCLTKPLGLAEDDTKFQRSTIHSEYDGRVVRRSLLLSFATITNHPMHCIQIWFGQHSSSVHGPSPVSSRTRI